MAEVIQIHYEMMIALFKRRTSARLLLSVGVSTLVLRVLYDWYGRFCMKRKLQIKQDHIAQRIDQLRERVLSNQLNSHLDDDEVQVLVKLDVGQLRERLQNGSIQIVDILQAFQRQALRLYDQGNSGICEFILEADEQAVCLQQSSAPSESRSPLFGIPVSIKEGLSVTGYDATYGVIKRCDQPEKHDSVIVQLLKSAGALPFVITTTSQCAQSLCGYNPIFGNSVNPFNASRIPGGSSTGEGVLLSQCGSPVGIGSDLAGSVRIPAAYCGLASLKPTADRLSSLGLASILQNSFIYLKVCFGPMGRRVSDLTDVMRTLLTPAMFELDQYVTPMPFNEDMYKGIDQPQLVIGYYDNLPETGIMQTVPVVRKSVVRCVRLLEEAGHKLVKFTPPTPLAAHTLMLRALFADNGKHFRDLVINEPKCHQLRVLSSLGSLPYIFKLLSDWIMSLAGYHPITVAHTMGGLSRGRDAVQLLGAIDNYRREYFQACRTAGPLDAIICPVAPYPAPPNSNPLFISPSVVYTALYNLVDVPAGTVPVGFVGEDDVLQSKTVAADLRSAGKSFDAKVVDLQVDSQGLPLSVQVVGMPNREELVLRVMKTIEDAVSVTH